MRHPRHCKAFETVLVSTSFIHESGLRSCGWSGIVKSSALTGRIKIQRETVSMMGKR